MPIFDSLFSELEVSLPLNPLAEANGNEYRIYKLYCCYSLPEQIWLMPIFDSLPSELEISLPSALADG